MKRSAAASAWVGAQFLLMGAAAFCGWFFRSSAVPQALRISGWILVCIAVLVGVLGAFALGSNLRPSPIPAPNAQLVQEGVYAWMRHPLYTAVLAGFLGYAFLTGSWPALLTWVALAVLLDAKARFEERLLSEHFPGYAGYARKVRRFIPGVY